jgi:putative ABC transport system permease protein
VKDFHFQSLHQPVAPLVIHTRAPVVNIYARLAPGSLPASMDVLEARWKAAAPELPLVATFLDEAVEAQYRREARAASTVRWAAGCALFVAALGLFGLAALAAQQRTREVGIRKALGASARRIALTLAGDLLRPVALAFAVGAPLAYLALERWLAGFAVRATVGPGLLAAVGAATAAVALLALAAHVVRAARLDPARTLREGG